MVSFLCKSRPRSVQAKYSKYYKQDIVNAFKKYYKNGAEKFDSDLYGIAYYFHKGKTDIDADNISKPIWDALEQTLYDSDKCIRLRIAGLFDINQAGSITVLNMKSIPLNVYDDFVEAIDQEQHLIYIEIGLIKSDLYKMGVE